MRAARKAGYAVSDGLVLPNVRGVRSQSAIRARMAIGSLGVASITDRASDERIAEFAAMLVREQAQSSARCATDDRSRSVAARPGAGAAVER